MIWKIENLSFSYSDEPFIHDINLTFSGDDKCVCLCGKNGAGKSTLFNAMCQLLPTQAKISKQEVTIIFLPYQDPLLENMSVKDNLNFFYRCFHHRNISYQDSFVKQLLTSFSVTFLDRKISSCSSGERKKVALICMLLSNANMIILDEPFVALDYQSTVELISFIQTYKQKKTFLITTHSFALAKQICDRLLLLESGTITKDTSNQKQIQDYFGTHI